MSSSLSPLIKSRDRLEPKSDSQMGLKLGSGAWAAASESQPPPPPPPRKLLLKVNIQNSFGAIQVVISQENTVEDLIKVVVEMYVKEKRRPFLPTHDPRCFQLHYSQFCMQGLKPEEKLKNLGSRNFFLWQKPSSSINSSYAHDQAKAEVQ